MPESYFSRTPTIRNEKDMFERLAQRTSGKLQPERENRTEAVPPALPVAVSTLDDYGQERGTQYPRRVAHEAECGGEALPDGAKPSSTPAAILQWGEPVKGEYPRATQTSLDGRYQIRRIDTKGRLLYYAWSQQAPIPKLLGYPPSAEQARALCQEHSRCAISASSSPTSETPSP